MQKQYKKMLLTYYIPTVVADPGVCAGDWILNFKGEKLLVYSDYTNRTNNTTKVKRCTVIKYTFVYI